LVGLKRDNFINEVYLFTLTDLELFKKTTRTVLDSLVLAGH
jgi:hypothetical protein